MTPYYENAGVVLYWGDCREVIPAINMSVDVVITDPPYGETSLTWDRWLKELPCLASIADSFWCFGTLRMFMAHAAELKKAGWKLSQDVIWEKHNGSGLMADRFRRVHEQAAHFYRGPWKAIYHNAQMTMDATRRTIRRKQKPTHWSKIKAGHFVAHDGGPRMMRSVMQVRSEHGRADNPTQKPLGILRPLIEYSCPPDGLILDPCAGSGSTLVAAKECNRRAIGIEIREQDCEAAARRLNQEVLPLVTA